MMDHIINFDWNYREPEEHFIRPEDLDNSVTERILRNKFRDPLISSDEEGDDNKPQKVNWNQLIENKNKKQQNRVFVPGLLKPPAYLKLSALTYYQHKNCLKVLCAQEPHILPAAFIQRPTKIDLQTMEAVRDIYENEQKEFLDWAKLLWATDHCRRVLRPKPRVEALYEAHFKIRAQEMQTFPKSLRLAAQIPLETTNGNIFDFVHQKDLISVNIEELPEVECPMNLDSKLCIMKPSPIPEPCPQHTCRFVLPTESTVTEKPLVEVYRALAQFAIENGATCVAEENALACLLEQDRTWMLPLSIVDTFGSDGEPCNIIVLGHEFDALKETPPVRIYRAFKHMLDVALVPETELFKLRYTNIKALTSVSQNKDANSTSFGMPGDDLDSSDDDDAMMIVDTGNDNVTPPSTPKKSRSVVTRASPRFSPRIQKMSETKDTDSAQAKSPEKQNKRSSGNTCTCKGSLFENPPPRSYRKWRLSNKTANDNIDVIIHCAHKLKVKDKINELILEPITEYQLDLGASQLPEGRTTSLELALILRKNATLANLRVNGSNGDVVRVDYYTDRQFSQQHGTQVPRIANVLHSAIDQLRGLLPGHYVLKHDPSHGPNALLFATKGRNCSEKLSLQFDHTALSVPDESLTVKTPPKLIPLLLPIHKHRTILPLAFTHVQKEVVQESKKPVTRAKPPPQALQWPKKKGRKRKQRN